MTAAGKRYPAYVGTATSSFVPQIAHAGHAESRVDGTAAVAVPPQTPIMPAWAALTRMMLPGY